MGPVETLETPGVATPLGHLSNVTKAGNRLYVAGLVSLDEQGELVGRDSVREQTLQIVRSLERICAEHGADLTNVARCLVFMTARTNYGEYDSAFAEAFGEHKPARATVIADLVNPDFLVEIVSDVELPAG